MIATACHMSVVMEWRRSAILAFIAKNESVRLNVAVKPMIDPLHALFQSKSCLCNKKRSIHSSLNLVESGDVDRLDVVLELFNLLRQLLNADFVVLDHAHDRQLLDVESDGCQFCWMFNKKAC